MSPGPVSLEQSPLHRASRDNPNASSRTSAPLVSKRSRVCRARLQCRACRPCLPSRAIDPDRSSKASLAADRTESRQPDVTAMLGYTERNARTGSALCRACLACTAGCRRNWPPAGRVADQNGDRILNNTCFWSRMAHQRTNTGICRRSGQSQTHSDVIVDNQHRQ